jgi:hypothetical protein
MAAGILVFAAAIPARADSIFSLTITYDSLGHYFAALDRSDRVGAVLLGRSQRQRRDPKHCRQSH